jgi:hypothetical protein
MRPGHDGVARTSARQWLARTRQGLVARLSNAHQGATDRGDVPGWVMIAVMTAALVVAILVPFRNTIIPAMTSAIQDMFGQAG